jgi:hypothetical protein
MRHYRVIAGSNLVRYNRDVLEILQEQSPMHADALNAHGSTLGWWNDIRYFHSQRYTPGQAAHAIMKKNITT